MTPACITDSRAARERVRAARLVLLDLDGVLVFGDRVHPDAPRFLAALRDRYVILTNNSTELPDTLAKRLVAAGVPVAAERILTAGALLIETLRADARGRRTLLLAGTEMRRQAAGAGLTLVGEDAEIVALARDTALTYDRLAAAVASLARGAVLLAANPDLTHPGAARQPVPETGTLLAALAAAVPAAAPRILGKPAPAMFMAALSRFGVRADEAVMIGDNPATDGAGAHAAGIAAILVGGAGHPTAGRIAGIEDLLPLARR